MPTLLAFQGILGVERSGRYWELRGIGVPERSRTSGLPLRRRLLYPAELLGHCSRAF